MPPELPVETPRGAIYVHYPMTSLSVPGQGVGPYNFRIRLLHGVGPEARVVGLRPHRRLTPYGTFANPVLAYFCEDGEVRFGTAHHFLSVERARDAWARYGERYCDWPTDCEDYE